MVTNIIVTITHQSIKVLNMNDYKLPSGKGKDFWERKSESRKESKIAKKKEDKNMWTPYKSW